jgi:hypothetical protein
MTKFKLVVDSMNLYLDRQNEERASITLCPPREAATDTGDMIRYEMYVEPESQLTIYYNGLRSGFPKVDVGDEITVSIG